MTQSICQPLATEFCPVFHISSRSIPVMRVEELIAKNVGKAEPAFRLTALQDRASRVQETSAVRETATPSDRILSKTTEREKPFGTRAVNDVVLLIAQEKMIDALNKAPENKANSQVQRCCRFRITSVAIEQESWGLTETFL